MGKSRKGKDKHTRTHVDYLCTEAGESSAITTGTSLPTFVRLRRKAGVRLSLNTVKSLC